MSGRKIWGTVAVLVVSAALSCAGPAAAASGISGHVVDTAGRPLEGIEVCPAYREAPDPGGCTRTDSNGDYSIPSGVPGELVEFSSNRYAGSAYAPQWWPGVSFSEEAQPVAEGDAGRVDATMLPGGTVSGRVVSKATSLPIEGVKVCPSPVVFHERESYSCASSDADGRFVLRGLSDAEYRLELWTERDVNFVATELGPFTVHTGGTVDLEASLTPGVEITGTVTDAETGAPAVALLSPDAMPRICAVAPVTEAAIKCTTFELDGSYALPGIPPDQPFGVSFAVDVVEEGLDLGYDGFVRRYWDEAPNWSESTLITGASGSVFRDVDAALTHGEEVFPHCEVKGSCASPSLPSAVAPPAVPPPAGASVPEIAPPPAGPSTAPARASAGHRCVAGFRRAVGSSKDRCVKAYKGSKRKKHRRHAAPRR